MPELPEAETIVRGLRRAVLGERITSVDVPRPDILAETPSGFAHKVRGRTIRGVERRGKRVVIMLDGGRVMVISLGMTGGLLPFPAPPVGTSAPTHPAVWFHFAAGGVLVFDDSRRFGTVECLSDEDWVQRSGRMGPEPLSEDFTPDGLHSGLSASRSPVRSWLLDQRRIAGVGNIYANEALHRAGIHPERRARGVTAAEAGRLHRHVREVLDAAIRAGGTTIRDYRNVDGNEGEYSGALGVYGRDGSPCPACGRAVRRVVFGGRSAFFCPGCQPRRRNRDRA